MGFIVFYPPSFLEIVGAIPDLIIILILFLALLPFRLLYVSVSYFLTSVLNIVRGTAPRDPDPEKYCDNLDIGDQL
ncbi:hypothetical protein TWF281_011910 [Arthrobotrys megalospora]